MNHDLADKRVALKVRDLAGAARITQDTLARALHTTQATASRKMSGKIPFRLDELDTVADLLGTTPDQLVTRNPQE